MSEIKQPEPLLFGHILGFMYLTFAHFTDGDVTEHEMSTITAKVGEWMGDSDATGRNTISEALDWYNSVKTARLDIYIYFMSRFKKMTEWEDDRLICVLDDLVSIAKADGNYDEAEKKWITVFSEALGLDYKA